jgi:hypothetical protein
MQPHPHARHHAPQVFQLVARIEALREWFSAALLRPLADLLASAHEEPNRLLAALGGGTSQVRACGRVGVRRVGLGVGGEGWRGSVRSRCAHPPPHAHHARLCRCRSCRPSRRCWVWRWGLAALQTRRCPTAAPSSRRCAWLRARVTLHTQPAAALCAPTASLSTVCVCQHVETLRAHHAMRRRCVCWAARRSTAAAAAAPVAAAPVSRAMLPWRTR